jgi:hypothetical protein
MVAALLLLLKWQMPFEEQLLKHPFKSSVCVDNIDNSRVIFELKFEPNKLSIREAKRETLLKGILVVDVNILFVVLIDEIELFINNECPSVVLFVDMFGVVVVVDDVVDDFKIASEQLTIACQN